MRTLFLNPSTWDLVVDNYGNIAVADNPYQYAQDVASACRLWKGEARYNKVRGVPYEEALLGKLPAQSMIANWYQNESLTIDGIVEAEIGLNIDASARSMTGVISLTTIDQEQITVTI